MGHPNADFMNNSYKHGVVLLSRMNSSSGMLDASLRHCSHTRRERYEPSEGHMSPFVYWKYTPRDGLV